MERVVLELPDALAAEAHKRGLLTSEALRAWLEGALKARQVEDFFATADRLADQTSLSPEDIEREVAEARQKRRCG